MTLRRVDDVEIGEELPAYEPDVGMDRVKRFARVAGMNFGRFTNHEKARKQGLPGALVPGIMSQGILAAMIHNWAPGCSIRRIDTIFRAPLIVGQKATCRGVITETDAESGRVEIDLTIENENQETRVIGTASVELARAG
jgi:acyl dehydratase